MFPKALLDPAFAELVRLGAETYKGERKGSDLSFIAFKQVPWHHYSRLSVELSQLTVRSPYLDNELVALMHQAPVESVVDRGPSLRLIAEGSPELARMPTDRAVLYRPTPLVSRIHQLYRDFTAKAEYAYDYGMPQWLARIDHVLAPIHVERLVLGRHKFYHFRIWYRDQLGEYLRDVLLDPRARARPYLDGRSAEKIVTDHVRGVGNFTSEIHRLLTAELLHRTLIDATS
jgi:asparagine synthase (glutamine-hydrolysing)